MNRDVEVRLSIQRALLGEVPPSLRAVVAEVSSSKIVVRCYFDGPVTAEDRESMSIAETEVIADFPDAAVRFACVQLEAPADIQDGGTWIYARRERR